MRVTGDWGIEAYVRTKCEVFQCHAAQGLAAEEIHRAQQSKLTRELAKFRANRGQIYRLVSGTIDRYVFLVPRFADRRIVDHASNKTNEFRAAAHAELSVKFEIVVLDEEQLRDEFGIASVYALPLEPPVEADRAGVAELAAATAKMENIDRKLGVAGIAEPEKTTLRAAFMDYAVRMQDFMDQLHADYEETWLTVSTVRTHRADRLRIDTALTSQAPDVFLGTTVREVADELTALPGLDRRKAEVLAYGFAGDWLLECPLDFRIAA